MSSWFRSSLTTLFISLLCIVMLGTGICCTRQVRHNVYMDSYGPEVDLHASLARVQSISLPGQDGGSMATAWAVTPDLLYTAGHFCDTMTRGIEAGLYAQELLLEAPNKKGVLTKKFKSESFTSHIIMDMCIISAPNHGLTPLKLHDSHQLLRIGDILLTAGYPKGVEIITYEEGRVGAILDQVVYTSIHVQPGASGSPVMWDSKVIGIVIKYRQEPHNCSILMFVPELQKFLDDYLGE